MSKPPLKIGSRYKFISRHSKPFSGTVQNLFAGTYDGCKYQRDMFPLMFWTPDVKFVKVAESKVPIALSQMHRWEEVK